MRPTDTTGQSRDPYDADADADDFFFAPPTRKPASTAPASAAAPLSKRTRATAGKKRPRNVEADDAGDVAPLDDGSSPAAAAGLCGRDDFLDSLHTLGKLLYAKRGPDGRLEYEPESIMATSAYDAGTTAAFLSQNAIQSFCDLADLSAALDAWSVADILLGHGGAGGRRGGSSSDRRSGGGGPAYPEQHAASIVSRAISTCNDSPAPSSFRPTRKPVIFAVERFAAENRRWVTSACLGLSCNDVIASGCGSLAIDSRLHVPSASEVCLWVLPALSILSAAERRQGHPGLHCSHAPQIGPREFSVAVLAPPPTYVILRIRTPFRRCRGACNRSLSVWCCLRSRRCERRGVLPRRSSSGGVLPA